MPNKFHIDKTQKTTSEYRIHIWDDIEDYEDYDDLLKVLKSIKVDDYLTLKISSPGGRCDIGFMLFDTIKALECTVEVIVPYPTYSMGALLSLVGNSLELLEGSFMMFHDFSTGTRGKGNEIKKDIDSYNEIFKYRFNQICQPFLTKKECEDILQGKDLYIKWNDKDLDKRLRRHFK